MPIKVKSGGVWRDVANGALRIRSGGVWNDASVVWIRYNGRWVDSRYIGPPHPPQGIWINDWTYNVVTPTWSAPAPGGSVVTGYHIVQTDANGNWTWQDEVGPGTTGYSRSVSPDQRLQFYVRAKSLTGPNVAGGLYSNWAGPVRVQIGHPEVSHIENQARTAPWHSVGNGPTETTVVNLYLDAYRCDVFVPADVHMESLYISLYNQTASPAWTKLSPAPGDAAPPNGRRLFWILNGTPQWADWHARLDVPNPWYGQNGTGWQATDFWGNNATWGFAIDGLGFSKTALTAQGIGTPNRIYGFFQIWGTRHYTEAVKVITTAQVDNSYW